MNELELGLSESLLEERCKTLMFSLELVVSLKLYPHWQTLNLYYKLCSLVYLGRLQVASIEICMLAWNCRDTQVTILVPNQSYLLYTRQWDVRPTVHSPPGQQRLLYVPLRIRGAPLPNTAGPTFLL